jgi:hypothetical protein
MELESRRTLPYLQAARLIVIFWPSTNPDQDEWEMQSGGLTISLYMLLQLNFGLFIWSCIYGDGFREQSSYHAVCSLHDSPHFTGMAEHCLPDCCQNNDSFYV